ncbi:MAG: GTPase, partial [Vulcanimicrobiaceae bacterium]
SGADPLVALVGYTNVGKSSLLNALAKSDALVADRPFATLDPTVRRVFLEDGRYIRLADTVGFITDLPAELVNAFRATLEELQGAALLVHVIDASNPDWPRQQRSVDAILLELQLTQPRVVVFNKIDAATTEHREPEGALRVSARTGVGLDALRAAIVGALA